MRRGVYPLLLALACSAAPNAFGGSVFSQQDYYAHADVPSNASANVVDDRLTDTDFSNAPAHEAVPGEVLVVYEDDSSYLKSFPSRKLMSTYGVESREVIADSVGGDGQALSVRIADDAKVDQLIHALENTKGVAYAQRNISYHRMDQASADLRVGAVGALPLARQEQASTNDPRLNSQYHLDAYDADAKTGTFADDLAAIFGGGNSTSSSTTSGANVRAAWDLVQTNGAVTIAVLDDGIAAGHEDLAANLDMAHAKDIYAEADPDTPEPAQGTLGSYGGHGVHVAGIAGAVANNGKGVAGASYNAKVIPINVYDHGGKGNTTSGLIVRALEYLKGLIDEGKLTDLHVVNLSMGAYASGSADGSADPALASIVTELRDDYNVLFVCSGGNGSHGQGQTTEVFPGDYKDCFSVTALTKDGSNAEYSDYNQYKDISAPGEDILSTVEDASLYGEKTGTSMSAPLVSGIAALLWAANPNLTCDQAVEAMTKTAHKITAQNKNPHSNSGSAGCIDAELAVKYVIDKFGGKASDPDEGGSGTGGNEGGSGREAGGDAGGSSGGAGTTGGTTEGGATGGNEGGAAEDGNGGTASGDNSGTEGGNTGAGTDIDTGASAGNDSSHGKASNTNTPSENAGATAAPSTPTSPTASTDQAPSAATKADAGAAAASAATVKTLDHLPATAVTASASASSSASSYTDEDGEAFVDGKVKAGLKVVSWSQGAATKAVYKVTNAKKRTVRYELCKRAKKAKSATVPANILINGVKYKVSGIAPKAFKNHRKLKTVTTQSKNLARRSVSKSLAGSKVKTVKVRVGGKEANRTYVKKYKKIFAKKNSGRKVSVC